MSRRSNKRHRRHQPTQAPLPRSARRTWEGRRAWHEVRPGESEFLPNRDELVVSPSYTVERIRGQTTQVIDNAPIESVTHASEASSFPPYRITWTPGATTAEIRIPQFREEDIRHEDEVMHRRLEELQNELRRLFARPAAGFEPEPDDPTLRNIDVY